VVVLERKWWTLIASCTAIFMLLVDVSIVNVALPSIQRALKASFSDLQWVVDAYALTLAGVLLAAGSLADKVGRRRVFTAGLAVFTASSLACGLSPDPFFLHISRALQGCGAAMMFGTSLALIAQEFHGRERGVALGAWGATTAAAVSSGPVLGGALTDAISWRWIFLVNVPIGIGAIVVAHFKVADSRDETARGVDLPGVAVLCPSLFVLVYALIRGNADGWGSPTIVGCLVAAAAGLVLFVLRQRTAREPLLDLRLFRKPAFTGATIVGFCLSASMFSLFLYITLFLQNVLHYSPFQAGLRQLPVTGLLLVVSPLSGRLTARVPVRLLLGTGLAFIAVGLMLMHGLTVRSGWIDLLPGLLMTGVGIGLATPALASTAVGVAPPRLSGMASGANNTARQLGIATGIAGLGAIFQSRIQSSLAPLAAGTPLAPNLKHVAQAVASGGASRVAGSVTPTFRTKFELAAHQAFINGFNTIILVAFAVAVVGSLAGYALVRSSDFVASGPALAPEAEPVAA
jgi:EmrB/QacA subfamily drug resistance transporter